MRKRLPVVGLALLLSALPSMAAAQSFLIGRYANNAGSGSPVDQLIRLINVGELGNPLTSPMGDVCANIYVFDNNQEMIACCSCRLTPNDLASASVGKQLTNNPLTSVVPSSGVIKILPIFGGTVPCSPVAPFAQPDASLLKGFGTHLEVTGGATYVTETNLPAAPLGSDEAAFLSNACLFVQYLGSGAKGTCGCTTPGQ